MSELRVQPVKLHEFSLEPALEGANFSIRLLGTADARAQRTIGATLPQVHAEALRLAVREVTVDYRELEFMNSSCFKEFITWLGEVRVLPSHTKYRIRFLSDSGKHWQRRSLTALSCFAVDLVEIEYRE
jgi:hypothetical protein